MRRLSFIWLLAAACLSAQVGVVGTYTAESKASVTTTAQVFTCRNPAGSGVRAMLSGASVYSSVAVEFTVERDGTFASGNGIAPAELNPDTDVAATMLCTAGTSISSTVVIGRQVVPAGGTILLDLDGIQLNAGEAITIRTASTTATVIANMKWQER